MAWNETCKIDFNKQVEHKTKNQGLSVRKTLQFLSEESGIPVSTLNRWLYPRKVKSVVKNDHTISAGNDSINQIEEITPDIIKDRHPQGGGKREGAGRTKLLHTETHEVTYALDLAAVAISQLERIKEDDPHRQKAFLKVGEWINNNIDNK